MRYPIRVQGHPDSSWHDRSGDGALGARTRRSSCSREHTRVRRPSAECSYRSYGSVLPGSRRRGVRIQEVDKQEKSGEHLGGER
jgi:hypothetical protein